MPATSPARLAVGTGTGILAIALLLMCVPGHPAAGRHGGAAQSEYPVRPPGHHMTGLTGGVEGGYAPALPVVPAVGLLYNTTSVEGIPAWTARGARYVEGSNVLQLPSGRWKYLPRGRTVSVVVAAGDPAARRQIAESRAWLAAGKVPGDTPERRACAERALLSMRALLQPNGALAAAWTPGWKYSWPRDASFTSAAFAHTGHHAEAFRILRYSAATQRPDGTWEARTKLDGSGPPDGRRWQLDANGWVPWATWQWYQAAPAVTRRPGLAVLYPMIRKAADYAASSLGADGLPPASPDYWELATTTPNIGTAAPLLAGLNSAADLAVAAGHPGDAARWRSAAKRLSSGISKNFAPLGYRRTADGRHGHDSAATFMAPPFTTARPGLARALDATYKALLMPNGGLTPGNAPTAPWGRNAWTPSTSLFALAWATTGERSKAERILDWLISKKNPLGELHEKVDGTGSPSSVAPLAWTGSITLLSLVALGGQGLPTPPSGT
ncbi:hypothetical protein [Streptomyces sp. NPDC048603]|uniref:hypothetical protein n=1 Tax=Streptomyces sp. NPDC048603 TaxID=3365577 RepID=UPI0037107426